MTDKKKEPIPAGWYQAPGESSLDRYWDGEAWTPETRPRPPAGLQPASSRLIEHDDRRHPLPWIFTVLGVALLIAAMLTWRNEPHLPATLLGAGGCLVLSVSTALLRADLAPRTFAAVSLTLGAALLVAGVVAALTITSSAWIAVIGALILTTTSLFGLSRAEHRPSQH